MSLRAKFLHILKYEFVGLPNFPNLIKEEA